MIEKTNDIYDLYWVSAVLQELLSEGKLSPNEFENLIKSLM